MPPSLLAAVAALVAALLWVSVRRRPSLAASFDSQAIAALNRAQIALVAGGSEPAPLTEPAQAQGGCLPLPATARERQLFLLALTRQLAGDAPQRLAAIEAASAWGQRASLPLLARGLRDVNPAVVQAAARAMERFRGRTCGALLTAQTASPHPLPLPRNVARTR